MTQDDVINSVKHGVDLLSAGVMLGTLVAVLPSIAAVFTIIWTAIRIIETRTFRYLLKKVFNIDYAL